MHVSVSCAFWDNEVKNGKHNYFTCNTLLEHQTSRTPNAVPSGLQITSVTLRYRILLIWGPSSIWKHNKHKVRQWKMHLKPCWHGAMNSFRLCVSYYLYISYFCIPCHKQKCSLIFKKELLVTPVQAKYMQLWLVRRLLISDGSKLVFTSKGMSIPSWTDGTNQPKPAMFDPTAYASLHDPFRPLLPLTVSIP